MFLFNSKDVYIGYSLEELSKVRDCLEMENIKYKYKVVNHSRQWRGGGRTRGNFGSFGTDMNYDYQYYVYVMKKDYDQAKYLVDIKLHNTN